MRVKRDKGKTEAAKLASESQSALQKLSASVPLAAELTRTAEAILVFPKITKAGLGIGGQNGEGSLLKKGAAVAYYKTTGASFGLQAGSRRVVAGTFRGARATAFRMPSARMVLLGRADKKRQPFESRLD